MHIYKSSEGRITWSQIREEVLAGWMFELRRVSFKTEVTYIVYIHRKLGSQFSFVKVFEGIMSRAESISKIKYVLSKARYIRLRKK